MKLKSWMLAHGEEELSGVVHIGECSEESEEMLGGIKRFQDKVVTISEELRHLSRVAHLILSSDPSSLPDHTSSLNKPVGARMALLHQLMTQLTSR